MMMFALFEYFVYQTSEVKAKLSSDDEALWQFVYLFQYNASTFCGEKHL
jgi:hypothetical protein